MGRKLKDGEISPVGNACGQNAGLRSEAPEALSQKGAMLLAKRLEHFWHLRGYPAARFWAEPIGERFDKVGSYDIYRVDSNLTNGLPPRYM